MMRYNKLNYFASRVLGNNELPSVQKQKLQSISTGGFRDKQVSNASNNTGTPQSTLQTKRPINIIIIHHSPAPRKTVSILLNPASREGFQQILHDIRESLGDQRLTSILTLQGELVRSMVEFSKSNDVYVASDNTKADPTVMISIIEELVPRRPSLKHVLREWKGKKLSDSERSNEVLDVDKSAAHKSNGDIHDLTRSKQQSKSQELQPLATRKTSEQPHYLTNDVRLLNVRLRAKTARTIRSSNVVETSLVSESIPEKKKTAKVKRKTKVKKRDRTAKQENKSFLTSDKSLSDPKIAWEEKINNRPGSAPVNDVLPPIPGRQSLIAGDLGNTAGGRQSVSLDNESERDRKSSISAAEKTSENSSMQPQPRDYNNDVTTSQTEKQEFQHKQDVRFINDGEVVHTAASPESGGSSTQGSTADVDDNDELFTETSKVEPSVPSSEETPEGNQGVKSNDDKNKDSAEEESQIQNESGRVSDEGKQPETEETEHTNDAGSRCYSVAGDHENKQQDPGLSLSEEKGTATSLSKQASSDELDTETGENKKVQPVQLDTDKEVEFSGIQSDKEKANDMASVSNVNSDTDHEDTADTKDSPEKVTDVDEKKEDSQETASLKEQSPPTSPADDATDFPQENSKHGNGDDNNSDDIVINPLSHHELATEYETQGGRPTVGSRGITEPLHFMQMGTDAVLTEAAPTHKQLPQHLDGINQLYDFYDAHEEIGKGNFASVSRVIEKSTGKEFALKIIDKEKIKGKLRLRR